MKTVSDYIYIYGSVAMLFATFVISWRTYDLMVHSTRKNMLIKIFEKTFEKVIEGNLYQMAQGLLEVTNFDQTKFVASLAQFRNEIYFYRFFDEAFYQKLFQKTIMIDDAVSKYKNTKGPQAKLLVMKELETLVGELFDSIKTYYLEMGKKPKSK